MAPKTIEETYQKKTQLENILLRPDTYVGSIEKHTQNLWVYKNAQMVHEKIQFVPALYKIFDEILVNASDQKQRDPTMDSLKVEIDAVNNCISVFNSGYGVPVEIHKEQGVYVPELIFGHLLTSSNYDDSTKKTTGDRNGYGAKLTNIFSTEFVIETADGRRQKMYKQVFSNNMAEKSEPVITPCDEGENWTKVSFKPDLAKFKMTHLEDDVVALMKKRVIDLAGCLGKTVKVELDGQPVPVESFLDYVDMYLQHSSKSKADALPRITEKVNDRWEVCVSLSDWSFQQVSFVNGIATIRGGTHVNYVTNQITNHMIELVSRKKKAANLISANSVKNYIWVFVNALIDNPAFDSQTKETLITPQSNFGSTCELSQAFLKKVAKSGVMERLLSWADFKKKEDLKRSDGSKKNRITGIPKLTDANDAGGENSGKCTLILTEGDSAKALAMAGISEVGSDYYGVFPLKGKLLNVREANHGQVTNNTEIKNIKKILGLKQGKEYNSVETLRYGHLMIMTDQDHDGSHIKGLIINLIHSFWPSLLKLPSFLLEFITPIVKATNKERTRTLSFYSMPEYESWKDSLGGNANNWFFKYYKGLGTSTSMEGKEYFQDLERHKKDFVWKNEQDGDAIELAFSKKKIEARKNWLRQFKPGTYLDQKAKLISYSDFVNKELILFSIADLQRSIPSMVDGLKPGQRKILYCAFMRSLYSDLKVAQFCGYVSEHSAYHHGEQSLASTIIGMAQDYVGSNNINLLQPNGQFGTRNQGGKDHASARYIFTQLSPITRTQFPKEDDVLLNFLNEDGQSIEPTWYMPIIPMVLVNGSEGIGTGWSSFVPNYNPRDIISNVRRLLNGEPMEPMDPWYKGFRGTITKTATKEAGVSYTISGNIEIVNDTTLRITELPIRKSIQDYKEFLESLMSGPENKNNDFVIDDYREHNDATTVHFEVFLSEDVLYYAEEEGLLKKFKLTTTISTSNMHLFDPNGVIKKYDTPEQILEEFFHIRLKFYEKRKKAMLHNLEMELLKLENKVRFIIGVVNGEIIVMNRKSADLLVELRKKGFKAFRSVKKTTKAAISDTTAKNAEDYAYLLSMTIESLTLENVQGLCAKRDELNNQVDELRKVTPKSLWMNDLDKLERILDREEKGDAYVEETRKESGVKNFKQAPNKNPPKNAETSTSNANPSGETMETSTSSAMETDYIPQAGPMNAPAEKEKSTDNIMELLNQFKQDSQIPPKNSMANNAKPSTEMLETSSNSAIETGPKKAPSQKETPSSGPKDKDENYEVHQQKSLLDNLEMELLELENKVRFIIGVVTGGITVMGTKRADLFVELRKNGFTPSQNIRKSTGAAISYRTNDAEDYGYLLSMLIKSLTFEDIQDLSAERNKLKNRIDDFRKATSESLLMKEPDKLEKKLDKEENHNKKATSTSASAEPMEKSITSAMEIDNNSEGAKPKDKGGAMEGPAQKDDDNDEILQLRERLNAYNLASTSDQTQVVETEVPQVQAEAADKETHLSNAIEISSDEDIEVVGVATVAGNRKKRGRKPANAKAAKCAAATRKRGAANKQTQITETLKVFENLEKSPEKKVMKTRASLFSKRSSLALRILGKEDEEKISTEGEEKAGSPASDITDEVPQVGEANAADKEKQLSTAIDISSEEDVEVANKKKGGKKPANGKATRRKKRFW